MAWPLVEKLFFAASLRVFENFTITFVLTSVRLISYRPFHKTLPRYSAYVNWISVRIYETGCRWNIFILIFKRALFKIMKLHSKFIRFFKPNFFYILHSNSACLWFVKKTNKNVSSSAYSFVCICTSICLLISRSTLLTIMPFLHLDFNPRCLFVLVIRLTIYRPSSHA